MSGDEAVLGDEAIEDIFAKSVNPELTAERLGWWTGRTFRVEKVDDDRAAFDPASDPEDELTPEEQKERRRRLIAEQERLQAEQSAAATAAGVAPNPYRTGKVNAMPDLEFLVEKINEAGLGLAVIKRFVEKQGNDDDLTEHQIVQLAMGACGGAAEFSKRYQGDDELGRILRTATMKARDAAWFKPTVVATGERAAAAAVHPGAGKIDPLRARIIADKRTAAPWMSEEELDRYAAEMARELDRTARGKAKPGTMERV
jgi:hypothetical protein